MPESGERAAELSATPAPSSDRSQIPSEGQGAPLVRLLEEAALSDPLQPFASERAK